MPKEFILFNIDIWSWFFFSIEKKIKNEKKSIVIIFNFFHHHHHHRLSFIEILVVRLTIIIITIIMECSFQQQKKILPKFNLRKMLKPIYSVYQMIIISVTFLISVFSMMIKMKEKRMKKMQIFFPVHHTITISWLIFIQKK